MNNDNVIEMTFKKVLEMNEKYVAPSHLPVVVLSSLNSAAKGELIALLNQALVDFMDKLSSNQGETKINFSQVTSNAYPVVIHDFKDISEMTAVPLLAATGDKISLSQGLDLCSNMLLTHKYELKNAGKPVMCPWLISITNGSPTDKPHETQLRMKKYVEQNSLFHIAINLSDKGANFPAQVNFDINESNLKQCFSWLSTTIIERTQSKKALKIKLPDFMRRD
ncbi:MAG: hypothetical protein ACK5NC_10955 [Vibrio sp.]